MALSADSLLAPVGEIDASVWFAGVDESDLEESLTGYLEDAYARTDDDDAARQWAYYRAATAVADAAAMLPQSASLSDQGSATFPAGMFAYWSAKAAAYLAEYTALVAALEAEVASPWPAITSLRRSA